MAGDQVLPRNLVPLMHPPPNQNFHQIKISVTVALQYVMASGKSVYLDYNTRVSEV